MGEMGALSGRELTDDEVSGSVEEPKVKRNDQRCPPLTLLRCRGFQNNRKTNKRTKNNFYSAFFLSIPVCLIQSLAWT